MAVSKHDYVALTAEYDARVSAGEDAKKVQSHFVDRGIHVGTFLNRRSQLKKATKATAAQEEPTADTPAAVSTAAHDDVSAVADIVPVTAEAGGPLSPAEVQTLLRYERIIDQGMQTFVEVGQALRAIRDHQLYREFYATFEDYLRQRWDLSRPYAYQLMDASEVVSTVSAVADIVPVNEAQARPLVSLPPEQQVEVWQEAVETAPSSGITAKHVQATVKRAKRQATGEQVRTPTPKAPEPRRPARQEVQEGLIWGLREVDDKDAWEILSYLWDELFALEPKYPSLSGMLTRVGRRFPDDHRSLMDLADGE